MAIIPNGIYPKNQPLKNLPTTIPNLSNINILRVKVLAGFGTSLCNSWFWYFAMQQLGDDAAAESSKAMKAKLQQRNNFSQTVGYFFPSMHTQLSVNALSRSDMTNYLNFLNQLEAFHEAKRLYFYPKIFDDMPIGDENWADLKLGYYQDNREINWLKDLVPLIIWSLLLLIFARRNW